MKPQRRYVPRGCSNALDASRTARCRGQAGDHHCRKRNRSNDGTLDHPPSASAGRAQMAAFGAIESHGAIIAPGK
jgi:hypothetical protein